MLMARLALLLTALALAGCTSYRPLYGDGGAALTSQLGNIAIEEVDNRAAQLVRNDLLLSVKGEASDSGYVLSLKPEEKKKQISTPFSTKLTRYRYTLTVAYVLRQKGSGNEVLKGSAFSNVSYDVVEEPIADLQAAENAQVRASREVAEDIRLRLAAFLSREASN
jgi:LPS-assembly lipoprotein